MTINELVVGAKEQTLNLANGYTANIMFDMYYKRWYYDLYLNGDLLYAGLSLTPDSVPLMGIHPYGLALIDKLNSSAFYEPFAELGSRLGLLEVSE